MVEFTPACSHLLQSPLLMESVTHSTWPHLGLPGSHLTQPQGKTAPNQTGGAVGSSRSNQILQPRSNTFSLRGYRNNNLTPSYSNVCD